MNYDFFLEIFFKQLFLSSDSRLILFCSNSKKSYKEKYYVDKQTEGIMQNIDYSRKLKPYRSSSEPKPTKSQYKKKQSIFNLFQQNSGGISFLYLLIGASLLFTSGLVIGMRIDQKENQFSENENQSIRNLGKLSPEESGEEEITAPKKKDGTENKAEFTDSFSIDQNTQKSTKSNFPISKDLKYPPKLNQVNYIIQLGTFSKDEANKWASILIKEKQEYQGRFFRTSSGKLYLGYYYTLKDANLSLKSLKKLKDGAFEESSLKKVEF